MTNSVIEKSNNQSAGKSKRSGQPSTVQRRWLERGLKEAGGKLPLFDHEGQRVSERTIRSCIEKGWAEPWFANPTKPDWMICRLTDLGRAALKATKVST